MNPANPTASPFGWHDTNGAAGAEFTTTQGNNVQAYTDVDANNSPDANSSPSGGAGLSFDFALNLAQAPSAYRPAAVTNLFYLNNFIHDVQYQYGFDEAGGNFQVNNYGRGGAGNDSVRAEAQDGAGVNNANFGTPPDGQRPRMQMFVWTSPNPDRDGDLDAGIVFHEYGHGISNRLVGGPANVNCLTNRQQPGEGLSDWWTLAHTAEVGDTGADPRGMGTYSLGQPTSGNGIRTQRYSTNPAVNTWTYASINGMAVPHGVGSVWAQAAWEVYWKLVDRHGFDPNLFNGNGNAGNQRMMLYVVEGLKNTACSPTFTQVRDGIIQAAIDNHGGEDVCPMWEAFAAFGLGTNAVSSGSNGTTPTNGFAIPASCQGGGGTVVFQDDFETSLWLADESERHRHCDHRRLGTRRSASHQRQRREAARHDDQRCQRSRHCTPGRHQRGRERHRRRRHVDSLAGDRTACDGHADADVQPVPRARFERNECGLPARERDRHDDQRGIPAYRRGDEPQRCVGCGLRESHAVRGADDPPADRSGGCRHGEPGRSGHRRRTHHAAVRSRE